MLESIDLIFPVFYAVINASSFILYGMDKLKAKKEMARISEKSLLTASFFGPIGAWFGMQYFRHKTQKPVFKFLVPLFIGVHIFLVLWISF